MIYKEQVWGYNMKNNGIFKTFFGLKDMKKFVQESNRKSKKLRKAATPLLKLLNTEYHPHVTVIITATSIELVEGVISIPNIHDYIVD